MAGEADRVEIGFGGPRSFGQEDLVVFQQRAFLIVQLHDRSVVIHQGSIIFDLRVRQPPFGVQQQVDVTGQIRADHITPNQFINGIDLGLRAAASIELGFHQLELFGDPPHRFGQHVRQLQFLFPQNGFVTGQLKFCILDAGQLAAEAQGDASLQANLPLLEVSVHQVSKGVIKAAAKPVSFIAKIWAALKTAAGIDQPVPKSQPAVLAHGVQAGQQVIFGRNQFQLALLDPPLLLPQIDVAAQRFSQHLVPLKRNLGRQGLVGRPDQPPVGGRESHQVPQPAFHTQQLRLGRLHRRAKEKVLFPSASFVLHADRVFDTSAHVVPDLLGGIETVFAGCQVVISKEQLPVSALQVPQQLANARLKISQRAVRVNPRQHDTVKSTGAHPGQRIERPGDAVVPRAGTLQ